MTARLRREDRPLFASFEASVVTRRVRHLLHVSRSRPTATVKRDFAKKNILTHGYNVGGVSNVAAIFFKTSAASAYLSSGHTAVSVNSRLTRPLYPMPTTE